MQFVVMVVDESILAVEGVMIQREVMAVMVVMAAIGFAHIVIGEGTTLIFATISMVDLFMLIKLWLVLIKKCHHLAFLSHLMLSHHLEVKVVLSMKRNMYILMKRNMYALLPLPLSQHPLIQLLCN